MTSTNEKLEGGLVPGAKLCRISVSDRTMARLALHALDLPEGHPIRDEVGLLLTRFNAAAAGVAPPAIREEQAA
jgi:hypothetical protein